MTSYVAATAYGGPEVLTVLDELLPEPSAEQVRIAVRAAGVNPIDFKSYSGMFGSDPAALPKRIGLEAAGVVTAVGVDAIGAAGQQISVGDEVIVYGVTGAYATDLVVPASTVVPKPPELSWPEAAGLLLTGVTAWHALAAAGVEAGDTVLIHAAAGGVGLMAVQLAVARGASVVGTASTRQHELLRSLGAVPVTYGDGLAARVRDAAPDGVDAALDLVGTDEAIDVSLELVTDRTRIVSIAGFVRGLAEGITLVGGGPGADPGTQIRAAARLQLTELAANGKLRVVVSQTFPLIEAAEAHRAVLAGHTTGKVVLVT